MSGGLESGGVLLADIGGTNARFALWVADGQGGGKIRKMHTLPTTGFATTENALDELAAQIDLSGLKAALFAIAGPVSGEAARLVNADWQFDLSALRSLLDVPLVKLINDFAAIGYAVPDLGEDMVRAIGPGGLHDRTKGPVLVIGPGTGLGLCIYVKDGDNDIVLPTEGGHATLTAFSAE
ncbi:MAG: glucokinase, partial [Alphaproteobacteria bacterium]|nr:glucokinase [Alphaproteobacteria bacterium]